jgi:hypothetical protein
MVSSFTSRYQRYTNSYAGMLLWLILVIDELKHCSSDVELEQAATNLPSGLDATYASLFFPLSLPLTRFRYGRILVRIVNSNNSRNTNSLAIRTLGWIACSYRPMKVHELLDGVSFNYSNTILTPTTKIHKQVLDLCRPLIEEGPCTAVNFLHFSAKE